jgi:D-glycero-alpha-D-manno-heptose-7-phosphate kinase
VNSDNLSKIIYSDQTKIRLILEGYEHTASLTDQKGFALIVNKKNQCIATLSEGDIRIFLVNGGSLDSKVSKVMNRKFIFGTPNETPHQILRYFDGHILNLPILDKNLNILDLINYSELNSYFFNKPKIIRAKVPVRVSFSGGGTDFSDYMKLNSTASLTSTINKFVVASVLIRFDREIHIFSRDLDLTYKAKDLYSIAYGDKLDLIKAAIKLSKPNFGFDIEVISDIKPGTGLGGSSAVTVAVIGALNYFKNEVGLDLYSIADLAYQAERVELKMYGGWQDQYATTFGGLNWLDFTTKEIIVNPLNISKDTMLELEFNLLLFKLGGTRDSGKIQSENILYQKLNKTERNKIYKKMLKTAISMKNSLLRGNVKEFGDLLGKSWQIKKQLGSNVSNKKIDNLYNFSIQSGALGGKLLGAGDNGYMLIYASPLYQKTIIDIFEKNGAALDTFSFTNQGLEIWSSKR